MKNEYPNIHFLLFQPLSKLETALLKSRSMKPAKSILFYGVKKSSSTMSNMALSALASTASVSLSTTVTSDLSWYQAHLAMVILMQSWTRLPLCQENQLRWLTLVKESFLATRRRNFKIESMLLYCMLPSLTLLCILEVLEALTILTCSTEAVQAWVWFVTPRLVIYMPVTPAMWNSM